MRLRGCHPGAAAIFASWRRGCPSRAAAIFASVFATRLAANISSVPAALLPTCDAVLSSRQSLGDCCRSTGSARHGGVLSTGEMKCSDPQEMHITLTLRVVMTCFHPCYLTPCACVRCGQLILCSGCLMSDGMQRA